VILRIAQTASFGPPDVRMLAELTVKGLLELLFRQFLEVRVLGSPYSTA
jgi:hypothetical protein